MAAVKANYVVEMGLGGAMFWDLPSDDFNNRCGRGSYPIIRGVSNIIKGKKVCKKVSEENGQLTTPGLSVTEKTGVETTSPGYSGGLKETGIIKMIVFAIAFASFL